MELLQRKILLGGLIGLLVIIIIFGVFLYRPKIVQSRAVETEVANLRKQVKENEVMAKNLENLREQVGNLEEAQRAFMAKVAPRNEMLSIVRQLITLAEPYHLTFSEIRPPGLDTLMRSDNQDRPLQPIPFVITIQGRYLDIAQYIDNLKEFPYFVRTPEIEVIAKQEIRPVIEVELLINIYGSSLVSGSNL